MASLIFESFIVRTEEKIIMLMEYRDTLEFLFKFSFL